MVTRTCFTVKPAAGVQGWDVDGPDGVTRFEMKEQALREGRLRAKAFKAPSQLQIFNADGTVYRLHTYGVGRHEPSASPHALPGAAGLALVVPGASPEAIARGLRAAITILEEAGVDPREAASASLEYQAWSVGALDGPTPAICTLRAAAVWCQARLAAVAACLDAAVPHDWPEGVTLTFGPRTVMVPGSDEEARREERSCER